jgi:hypothetical protein
MGRVIALSSPLSIDRRHLPPHLDIVSISYHENTRKQQIQPFPSFTLGAAPSRAASHATNHDWHGDPYDRHPRVSPGKFPQTTDGHISPSIRAWDGREWKVHPRCRKLFLYFTICRALRGYLHGELLFGDATVRSTPFAEIVSESSDHFSLGLVSGSLRASPFCLTTFEHTQWI